MALTESTAKVPRRAPDFSLPNVDGKTVSLSDFKEKLLVIVFTCNHCPYAKAAWPELIKLSNDYQSKGVDFVAINPNDETKYPEDSFDMMKERAREWKIPFPYLRDESQAVARAYNAQCTPDIYVYNRDRQRVSHGRLNSNWQDPTRAEPELQHALDTLLAGGRVMTQYPSMGCSIKWRP